MTMSATKATSSSAGLTTCSKSSPSPLDATTMSTTTPRKQQRQDDQGEQDDDEGQQQLQQQQQQQQQSPATTSDRDQQHQQQELYGMNSQSSSSPFTTATDVIGALNRALSELYDDDGDDGTTAASGGATAAGQNEPIKKANNNKNKPRFELQKRLPDGSARPATELEQKAANVETKMKQVAEYVRNLKTKQEKMDFAERHRQYGNTLYAHRKYEDAIDVYLTCLTVAVDGIFVVEEKKKKNATSSGVQQSKTNEGDEDVVAPTTTTSIADTGKTSSSEPEQASEAATSGKDVVAASPTTIDEEVVAGDDSCFGGDDDGKKGSDDDIHHQKRQQVLLFCKVMNNLAQSAIQLKWYGKAEKFCTIALENLKLEKDDDNLIRISEEEGKRKDTEESLSKSLPPHLQFFALSKAPPTQVAENPDEDNTSGGGRKNVDDSEQATAREQICKIYYKCGKARRLRGSYKKAKLDLNESLRWLDGAVDAYAAGAPTAASSSNNSGDDPQQKQLLSSERKAIDKEIRLLATAVAEGRRNKERQQKAMKKVLSSSAGADGTSSGQDEGDTTGGNGQHLRPDRGTASVAAASPLYSEEGGDGGRRRLYSTLRAPSDGDDDEEDDDHESRDAQILSQLHFYWRWYISLVGRVAKSMLLMIGDDGGEDDNISSIGDGRREKED